MIEYLVPIGFLIVIVGMILIMLGIMLAAMKQKVKVESGGIIFIGPFPILGFATRKEIFYALLLVSIVIIIAFLILGKKFL